jgi:hypothetical protein
MDVFTRFKQSLKESIATKAGLRSTSAHLLATIEASEDWEALERRLVELRTLNRKRQQEALERMEPLARRIEGLLARARAAKLIVVRQSLQRQAEEYEQELESYDEPSKVYSANCRMLTELIKQIQRGRAMAERFVEADSIDAVAARLEEIVVTHEAAMDAVADLEPAMRVERQEVGVDASKDRLPLRHSVEVSRQEQSAGKTASETGGVVAPAASSNSPSRIEALERKLYED